MEHNLLTLSLLGLAGLIGGKMLGQAVVDPRLTLRERIILSLPSLINLMIAINIDNIS